MSQYHNFILKWRGWWVALGAHSRPVSRAIERMGNTINYYIFSKNLKIIINNQSCLKLTKRDCMVVCTLIILLAVIWPGRPFQNITTQRSAWKVKLGRMCYPSLTYIVCLQQRKKKVDQLFAGGQRTAGPLSLLSGDGARLGGVHLSLRHRQLSLRHPD